MHFKRGQSIDDWYPMGEDLPKGKLKDLDNFKQQPRAMLKKMEPKDQAGGHDLTHEHENVRKAIIESSLQAREHAIEAEALRLEKNHDRGIEQSAGPDLGSIALEPPPFPYNLEVGDIRHKSPLQKNFPIITPSSDKAVKIPGPDLSENHFPQSDNQPLVEETYPQAWPKLNANQVRGLEDIYLQNTKPSVQQRREIAERLSLTQTKVKVSKTLFTSDLY